MIYLSNTKTPIKDFLKDLDSSPRAEQKNKLVLVNYKSYIIFKNISNMAFFCFRRL